MNLQMLAHNDIAQLQSQKQWVSPCRFCDYAKLTCTIFILAEYQRPCWAEPRASCLEAVIVKPYASKTRLVSCFDSLSNAFL